MAKYGVPDYEYEISYKPVYSVLEELPVAIANRLGGDRREEAEGLHPGIPTFGKLTLRVCDATYKTARYICSDTPDDPMRLPILALSVPILSRAMLDALMNIIFMFDDPSRNARWYFAAEWKDVVNRHKRLFERYKNDTNMEEWLKGHERYARLAELDVTEEEKKNPNFIIWWPHPGVMLLMKNSDGSLYLSKGKRRDFISYLNQWYYGPLSGSVHLNGLGLAERGGLLSDAHSPRKQEYLLERVRSQYMFTATTINLAILSEFICQFDMKYEATRILPVWKHFEEWPEAKEIFEKRYQSWLPISAT